MVTTQGGEANRERMEDGISNPKLRNCGLLLVTGVCIARPAYDPPDRIGNKHVSDHRKKAHVGNPSFGCSPYFFSPCDTIGTHRPENGIPRQVLASSEDVPVPVTHRQKRLNVL